MQIRDTWSSNNRSLHWKVKFWSMTLGQGHDLTQTGHATCRSVCLDARNTVNLFWSLYHAPIKSYCSNTVFDLWWRHVTSGVQKRAICSNGVKIHFSRQHSLLLSVFWGYRWEFTIIGGLRIVPTDSPNGILRNGGSQHFLSGRLSQPFNRFGVDWVMKITLLASFGDK